MRKEKEHGESTPFLLQGAGKCNSAVSFGRRGEFSVDEQSDSDGGHLSVPNFGLIMMMSLIGPVFVTLSYLHICAISVMSRYLL